MRPKPSSVQRIDIIWSRRLTISLSAVLAAVFKTAAAFNEIDTQMDLSISWLELAIMSSEGICKKINAILVWYTEEDSMCRTRDGSLERCCFQFLHQNIMADPWLLEAGLYPQGCMDADPQVMTATAQPDPGESGHSLATTVHLLFGGGTQCSCTELLMFDLQCCPSGNVSLVYMHCSAAYCIKEPWSVVDSTF